MLIALPLVAVCVSAAAMGSSGYLHIPIKRTMGTSFKRNASEDAMAKRDSVSLNIKNERVFYSAQLLVGSNNQELNVIVDTGSSDTWIPSSDVQCNVRTYSISSNSLRRAVSYLTVGNDNALPSESEDQNGDSNASPDLVDANIRADLSNPCTSYGSFDYTQSTSFNLNLSAPMFSLAYLDGTKASGFWGTDEFKFGSSIINDFSFAVANVTSSDLGVLGIGLADLQSTAISPQPYTYENFPMRLKATGQIQTNAYSLYLNDVTAKEGVLLFGAVDHAKYIGTLQSVPVVRLADSYMSKPRRLLIVMHGILVAADDEDSIRIDKPVVALLDSGSTFSYLPLDIILELANNLEAKWNEDRGLFSVECEKVTGYSVTFSFSGIQIKVPFSNFVILSWRDCYLTLANNPSTSQEAILGDNFLRNVYVIYDLDNYEVAMAPVKYTTQLNIEVISSTIPQALRAAGYSSTSVATSMYPSVSTTRNGLRKSAAESQNRMAPLFWAILWLVVSLLVL